MKKKEVSDEEEFSGEDAEDVEGGGSEEDWAPETGEVAPKRPRRSVKKRSHSDEEEEDEEDEDDEDFEVEDDDTDSDAGKKSKKPRRSKKQEEEEEEDSDNSYQESTGVPPKDFTSGAFVVAKADLKDKSQDPVLWRIDGKALLQKYLPYKDNDGKSLYRSTSTYSGWSSTNKDRYLAAQITFRVQSRSETIVELHLDQMNIDDKDDKE